MIGRGSSPPIFLIINLNTSYLSSVIVDIKHHQLVDIIIVGLFVIAIVQSYFRGTEGLDILSTISMYFMAGTIVVGIIVAFYVHFTRDQIFDPLSSELDEDPDCIEDEHIKLS